MFRFNVFPAWMEWPDAVSDVAAVEPNAKRLRLISKAASFGELSSLEKVEDIWCFDINEERLDVIARCGNIRRLFIDGLKSPNLAAFAELPKLEVLSLESCSKVSSLIDLCLCLISRVWVLLTLRMCIPLMNSRHLNN